MPKPHEARSFVSPAVLVAIAACLLLPPSPSLFAQTTAALQLSLADPALLPEAPSPS